MTETAERSVGSVAEGWRRATVCGLATVVIVASLLVPVRGQAAASPVGSVLRPHAGATCSGVLPSGAVVGMTATPDDGGYWISDRSGSVVACGDAVALGSLGVAPAAPIVGMAPTPSGAGYWLVAADGGIFAFGDAGFHGSTGALRLNQPIVGMAPTPSGAGYWLVAADGGIFAFGAPFLGSTGGITLERPITGMTPSPGGHGYRFVASDGGIFAFGAAFYGSAVAPPPLPPPPPPAPGIPVGPGPQATYTVQPQPAPGTCHYRFLGTFPLPDAGCTPGATNPQVTQATIGSTICVSGYTSSIRPPSSITSVEKTASKAAYSYTGSPYTVEYDHLIPLELGGDPNDPRNLWAEPNDDPNATSFNNSKDLLENRLNALVCSGQLSLAAAQQAIATNWIAAYLTYG